MPERILEVQELHRASASVADALNDDIAPDSGAAIPWSTTVQCWTNVSVEYEKATGECLPKRRN
jgi:hypothetical protein